MPDRVEVLGVEFVEFTADRAEAEALGVASGNDGFSPRLPHIAKIGGAMAPRVAIVERKHRHQHRAAWLRSFELPGAGAIGLCDRPESARCRGPPSNARARSGRNIPARGNEEEGAMAANPRHRRAA